MYNPKKCNFRDVTKIVSKYKIYIFKMFLSNGASPINSYRSLCLWSHGVENELKKPVDFSLTLEHLIVSFDMLLHYFPFLENCVLCNMYIVPTKNLKILQKYKNNNVIIFHIFFFKRPKIQTIFFLISEKLYEYYLLCAQRKRKKKN